jgi:hypothetical protein
MQSGTARTRQWVLDYEPAAPRAVEPLMGWTSSTDMLSQISMTFETKEAAVAYATRHGIPFEIAEPHARTPKPKAYSDNFRHDRTEPWTH